MKRPHLIFVPFPLNRTETFLTIDDKGVLAQMKALRLAEESECVLFDEKNHRGLFRIQKWTKKNCTVDNLNWTKLANCPTPQIQLIQCLAKGNKMDLILQKATELGVISIQVLCSERSVPILQNDSAQNKTVGYRRTICEAVRQSEISHIPQVLPLLTFNEWIKREPAGVATKKNGCLRLIFCEEEIPSAALALRKHSIAPADYEQISVLIGPEGGLTEAEIELSFKVGFIPIHLPGGILRVETAAVVALTLLRFAKYF